MGKVVACLLWALLLAGPAIAAPITFNFTSGEATVTGTTDPGGVVLLPTTTVPMDGDFVTFDAVTADLVDLNLTIPTTMIIALTAQYGGYDEFRIESAMITAGTGFNTVIGNDLGGGFFSFIATGLDIDGIYSAFDSTTTNPDLLNLPFPFTDSSNISGTININTGELTMSGITLAVVPGGLFSEPDDLSIKVDIAYQGIVPEPGTAVLLGLGLVGLASSRRRNLL